MVYGWVYCFLVSKHRLTIGAILSRSRNEAAALRGFVPRAFKLAVCALMALGICMGAFTAYPSSAHALEVQRLTAQPNTDSGSDVVGGTETRLTLEFQADETESLEGVTIELPEGASCSSTDDARITILSGEDLMDREAVYPTFSLDGQKVTAKFKATETGKYFRFELYGVTFPVSGGDQEVKVSYKLADGSTHAMKKVPAVKIASLTVIDQLKNYLEDQEWVKAWNSNLFLKLFLNPPIMVSSLPVVFQGFLMALKIVLVAFPLAIPFGFCLSLMRLSKLRVLRALSGFYINIVRGTPAFLQIYIAFFGLPLAGIKIDNYPLGVIVMAMNSAAYLCEIFRAGIQSIPKGQNEAARSLGMNAVQTLIYVIVPQTVRNVLPTMTSEFILLYKDTSLLAAVGVTEIVMGARTIVATTGSITPYVVAALFYLVVTLPLTKLVGMLEARLMGGVENKKKRPAPADQAAVL